MEKLEAVYCILFSLVRESSLSHVCHVPVWARVNCGRGRCESARRRTCHWTRPGLLKFLSRSWEGGQQSWAVYEKMMRQADLYFPSAKYETTTTYSLFLHDKDYPPLLTKARVVDGWWTGLSAYRDSDAANQIIKSGASPTSVVRCGM